MINNQQGRRNLTDGWKFELAQLKKELLIAKGRAKMLECAKITKNALSVTDKPFSTHNTQREMAKELGKERVLEDVYILF